jgi:hypothetical protein
VVDCTISKQDVYFETLSWLLRPRKTSGFCQDKVGGCGDLGFITVSLKKGCVRRRQAKVQFHFSPVFGGLFRRSLGPPSCAFEEKVVSFAGFLHLNKYYFIIAKIFKKLQ